MDFCGRAEWKDPVMTKLFKLDRRTALKTIGAGIVGGAATTGSTSARSSVPSDEIREHTVTGGGGIDIHVDETGAVDEPPILFIHGFSGSGLVWGDQLLSDLKEDFRLVAVDLRGHGRSEKPEDAYAESELWAADIQAVIDELGLDDPVLVGWSMGAVWIADYLSVEGEDDIAGVNLVGPAPLFEVEDPTTVFGEGFLDFLERGVFVSTDVEESITGIDEFISLVTAEPLPPRERVLLFGIVATVPPRVRANLLAREVAYDDLLPEIESPVLITHGEEDELILPGVARRICEAIPNARTSFYPEVGHAPFLEDSERFNRELREFAAEPC